MSHKPAYLLLVDDDPGLLKLLGLHLTGEGYNVITTKSGVEELRVLNRRKVGLVTSDLRVSEMDGMQLFTEIQKMQPGMSVIILIAHGSISDAVAATQQDVLSFLAKPADKDALYQTVDDALEQSAPATGERWHEAIVTRNPLMLRLPGQAQLVAQSDVSVLVNNQSDTGEEIFAQAIHSSSPRNSKPFVTINCGALPKQLLGSELLGHARSAFAGAINNREGLFQTAEGDTLFLDEIDDMLTPLQIKLLRVLQERKVYPLGSNRGIDVGMRIISATHYDLPKAITRRGFRKNPYYRLNVVGLRVPALTERTENTPLLANHLLHQATERHRPSVHALSTDAVRRLMTASWPGNVHQSVNVIEQCVALTSSPVISDALMEQALGGKNTALPTFVEAHSQFKLNYLRKLLRITKGNVTHATRMAGRSRTEFYKLLSRHELSANDFKKRIGVMCYVWQIERRVTFSGNSMKRIGAIIKLFKLDNVREALAEVDIIGMTVAEMKDFGHQKNRTELYRGMECMVGFLPKVRIEIVISGDIVDTCADTVIHTVQTGEVDGDKIFVFDVAQVICIRTDREDDTTV